MAIITQCQQLYHVKITYKNLFHLGQIICKPFPQFRSLPIIIGSINITDANFTLITLNDDPKCPIIGRDTTDTNHLLQIGIDQGGYASLTSIMV